MAGEVAQVVERLFKPQYQKSRKEKKYANLIFTFKICYSCYMKRCNEKNAMSYVAVTCFKTSQFFS
jgi:hypothetical protein